MTAETTSCCKTTSGANSEMNCGCSETIGGGVNGERRNFLKGAAAGATMAIAPGVTLITYGANPAEAKEDAEAVTDKKRWGLLIDAAKFDDEAVDACVAACQKENGWEEPVHPDTDAQWIRRVNVKNRKTEEAFSLPMMCQHCEKPPCVDVCPTGASFKRADGIVLVDKHICIGCRYCMMACPYKARSFIHEELEDQKDHAPRGMGTVESCTLCVHRVDKGGTPACVEAAPAGSMIFGDLNDPKSEIAKRVKTYATHQIRADLGLNPGVRYQNI